MQVINNFVLLIEVICKLGVGVRGRWYIWWFKFSWDRPVRLHVLFDLFSPLTFLSLE